MSITEINALFAIASKFAEQSYYELFSKQPDTANEATRQILDMLMQAWLSGCSYMKISPTLESYIEEIFGFYIDLSDSAWEK